MNDTSTLPRRRNASRGKIIAVMVVALGLIGFGYWKLKAGAEDESEYLYAAVQMGDIEDLVTATGTLEPREFVDVGAQVSGQIEEIFVEVGDEVKKGDILAKIDATTSQARVESNRARLEGAKTSLESQKTNLEKALRDYTRQQNLLKEDATTQEAVLNAKTAYDNAVRSVRSSELTIQQQDAEMRIEAKNLGYTTITAPIDGTVMSIQVKEGQSVNASQNVPVVLRLADLGTMTVRADVSEADYAKLYKGMSLYFTTLGAAQNRRYNAQLKRLEPTPKTSQGVVLYPALFDVQNEDDTLRSGMTAQVYFIAAEVRNVLTVPMAALQQGQQIARELAEKEGEKKKGEEGERAGAPNAMARGGAENADGPEAAATSGPGETGGAPGAAGPGRRGGEGAVVPGAAGGQQQANAQRGAGPGEGQAQGQRPGRQGGFGGQRGAGGGNFGGNFTPEQIEEFRRTRGAGGGGPGGFGGFAGSRGMQGGPGAGAPRQPQQRRGTVMVKKADGTLEPRQVVVGVTNRVHGQVLEGLTEGEEVVVGMRDTEPQTGNAAQTPQNNQNFNQNFRGNQGGFPAGGGGGRPF